MKRILMATTAAAVIGAFALTGTSGFADSGHDSHHGTGAGMMGQDMGSGMMMGRNMGPGMMMGQGPGMMGPNGLDTALADVIKDRLEIGAGQEPAWQAYLEALRGSAETMRSMQESMSVVHDPQVSAEERVALMDSVHESGRMAFDELAQARDALFAVLGEKQKADARRLLPGLMMGPGMMMNRQGMMIEPCNGSGGSEESSKT